MKNLAAKLLLIASVYVSACKPGGKAIGDLDAHQDIADQFNTSWADSSLWDDGKAEVAVYDATRTIYKKERRFEYTYITVSEDFNAKFRVKTDDYNRDDLYKVMKVNAFARIETDNYPYHFLSNLFFIRKNPLVLDKFTTSSQEWCGNTFKEFLNLDNDILFRYHSYWDGEGDGEQKLPQDILFEDQLNYTLRSLNFKNGLNFKAKVLSTQISSKVNGYVIYLANFTVSKADTAWKVTVKLDAQKTNEYVFAAAYPNMLLKQTTWDGRNLRLKKVSRYAYWQN